MNSSNSERRAIFQMAACAGLWSIAGIFIKLLPWNSLVIAGMRSLIAAIVVALFMRFSKQKLKINRASVMSGILITCTFFAFVSANKLTTAANAIVLEFTAPIFIMIISALVFHQHFHKADVITVVIAIVGISLFFWINLVLAVCLETALE